MNGGLEETIRQAIGGDPTATRWVTAAADTTDIATVIVLAALLEHDASRLDRALGAATTSRDRQMVEIARAHLAGRRDLVDLLARDHLVDHPDHLLVAWVAGGAIHRSPVSRPEPGQ